MNKNINYTQVIIEELKIYDKPVSNICKNFLGFLIDTKESKSLDKAIEEQLKQMIEDKMDYNDALELFHKRFRQIDVFSNAYLDMMMYNFLQTKIIYNVIKTIFKLSSKRGIYDSTLNLSEDMIDGDL